MPMDRSLYPANWEQIALEVKAEAGWRCKWCDKPCREPGEEWHQTVSRILSSGELNWYLQTRDGETNAMGETRMVERPQRFVLTTAHYPDHDPSNCDRGNLVALCSTCHTRLDLSPSALAQKRQIRLEREGQLSLLTLLDSPPVQPTATAPPAPNPHPVAVPAKPAAAPPPKPPAPGLTEDRRRSLETQAAVLLKMATRVACSQRLTAECKRAVAGPWLEERSAMLELLGVSHD
ncbi:hypothetical protein [Prochlorothrix hollandica]|uniref:hypothetical protein n=1 Tax=Prochlorothrix hollandica TaxID=1223 RepID=UPI0003778A5F|nr:hypothetical protein [Prochlorothrix hollandica]